MRAFLTLLMTALLLGSLGCSSAPERADKAPVESDDPLDLNAPTPEAMADSPCGNPDWSKLPPSMPKDKSTP